MRRLAAGLLLAVAGLLGVSAAAQAQTTYVSNIGQALSSSERSVGISGTSTFTQAQPFHTGDNADGYTLTAVVVKVGSGADAADVPKVSIYLRAAGHPGASLYTLTNPVPFASGDMIFTAPANATLAKGGNYFVVVEETAGGWNLKSTPSDDEGTVESGWSIGDSLSFRDSDDGAWSSNSFSLLITIKGATPVTIEAQYDSIGAGLEDLVFTLTREGETTDVLPVKVTIVQDQTWLSDLEYTVTFLAGEANKDLTIPATEFSFTPSTTGNLTATVTGDGIDGGSDTVAVISTSEPPITISYDMSAYTFAENATDAAVYLVATLDAAYPREPSRDYFVTFSTTFGTAEDPEDYVTLSERESFTRSEYGRDADTDTDPFVARKLLSDFGFAIVDDAIYEGSERFGLIIEPDLTHVTGMAVFQKPDGTTCEPFGDCPNPPFEYPVTITDEGDLPALLLSAVPASIAEEDVDGTTGTAENVSTVMVEITNGKTFAVDQTVTLTFSGTATQGTHYSVNPGDADPNTAGHQVVLPTGDSSVEVTVTATGNDTADRNRTVTVAADLDGTAIGSTDITILDDETTNTDATGQPLITGTARVGGELTATKHTIADMDGLPATFPGDYTFAWVRVDTETPIGTDSNNYTVLSADAGSTIRVDVSFTDGAGNSEGPLASAETAVVVANNAPMLDIPIPDQSAPIGTAFSYTVPANTFSDADNDPLTYTATKDDGTPLPAWLSFDPGTRTFSGTPPTTVVIPLPLKVTASDGYGGSVSDMFDINAISVPFAPTGLTATASGTTTINLSWTPPPNNGGSVITGYKIEVSADNEANWDDLDADTDDTDTTYAHTGLAPGTTRHYRVSAINSVGTGAASNVDNATTDAAAATCLAPTLTGRMQIWTGTVTVGANAVDGLVGAYGFGTGYGGTGRHPIPCRHEQLHRGPRAGACEPVDSRRISSVRPDRRAGGGGQCGAHPACLRRRVRLRRRGAQQHDTYLQLA